MSGRPRPAVIIAEPSGPTTGRPATSACSTAEIWSTRKRAAAAGSVPARQVLRHLARAAARLARDDHEALLQPGRVDGDERRALLDPEGHRLALVPHVLPSAAGPQLQAAAAEDERPVELVGELLGRGDAAVDAHVPRFAGARQLDGRGDGHEGRGREQAAHPVRTAEPAQQPEATRDEAKADRQQDEGEHSEMLAELWRHRALTSQVSIGQGHGPQGAIEARSCAPLTPEVRIVRNSAPCRPLRARYEPPGSGAADFPGQARGAAGASRVARSDRDRPDPRRGDPRRDGRRASAARRPDRPCRIRRGLAGAHMSGKPRASRVPSAIGCGCWSTSVPRRCPAWPPSPGSTSCSSSRTQRMSPRTCRRSRRRATCCVSASRLV